MSPITHRVQSFRKLRDKYSRLRTRAICERDKTIAHGTAGWVLNHQELKEMLQGLEDGTIMRSIEPSDWCRDDSRWKTEDTGVDRTEMDTNFERSNGAGGKDESEAAAGTITVTEVVDTSVSESDGDFKMDWESTISGSFEGVLREREDISDAALGEGVELSDLLQLEKEQPDDISNLEALTRPTSQKQDNTPPTSNRLSIDFNYFDWDDLYDEDYDEFPATEFFHTDTAISDAEWALESLEPFKNIEQKPRLFSEPTIRSLFSSELVLQGWIVVVFPIGSGVRGRARATYGRIPESDMLEENMSVIIREQRITIKACTRVQANFLLT